MNRSMLVLATLALGLLLPAAAAAKGPSSASITGGSLAKAIKIAGNGETEQTPLGRLTMEAGFFPAAFGQSPDPMLHRRPTGLGPKLIIRYVVPGGDNQSFHITQAVYPYAKGGAVTYMRPNQPIFEMGTIGGWYRAYGLKRTLVAQGLPARAPASSSSGSSSGSNFALLAGIGIPGALVLAGTAVFFRRRKA
jgi:LPXTG-motif cell wall-anchored protein